jgi:hypothetical protein
MTPLLYTYFIDQLNVSDQELAVLKMVVSTNTVNRCIVEHAFQWLVEQCVSIRGYSPAANCV